MANRKLSKAIKSFSNQKQKIIIPIQGILGLPLNGTKLVEVPNRKGFVYVRLRDNTSEVIQAYNSEVSTIYGLAVLVARQNNIYKVIGRDQDRYQDWGNIPYLPKHGGQHSFNQALGMGADITWVYTQQFMPLLGYPSGTQGSNGIIISPYTIRDLNGNWKYVGNTGTPDITMYRPSTGTQAVMVLVYIDSVSGNPYLLVGSGSYFSATLTGSSDIAPYIPPVTNPEWIPDTAVRLTSGTTQIFWGNMYDVRPFLQVSATGTSGGSGGTGTSLTIWDEGIPQGTATTLNVVGTVADISVSGTVARLFVSGTPYADQNRYLAPYNYFIGSGSVGYKAGLVNSPDLRNWKIRKEPIIDVGVAGQWDDHTIQFPRMINYQGVLYTYYAGKNTYAWSNFQIGLSISYDFGYTWNKYGGNPILSGTQAWENNLVADPLVFYDRDEPNPNAKFKMWYLGSSFGEGIGYAYAPSPTGTFTKWSGNPVVSLGAGGQWDDTYVAPHAVIRRTDGTYLLFYGGKTGAAWQSGLVTFTNPTGTYIRSPYNPILRSDGIGTTLTANLTAGSTTATVANSAIFPIGCPVWVGYTSRFLTRIINRPSATTVTLADAAPFLVSSGDVIISVSKGSLDIRSVFYDDGYTFGIVAHQPDGLTENGVHEVTLLAWSEPQLQTVNIDYGAGIQVPITLAESQNTSVSRENWSIVDMWDTYQGRIPPPTGSSSVGGSSGILGVMVQDEGVPLGTGTTLNFVGSGVDASISGSIVRVSINNCGTYLITTSPNQVAGSVWQVPDRVYASGSLAYFYNGLIQYKGVDYQELVYVSGTFQLLFTPATGSYHTVMYGIPCTPQTYTPTGTGGIFDLVDSDSVLLTDSDGIQLTDSDG